MSKTFYITTAIDYVNSLPHIGTAYEKIGADVIARWMRKKGHDVHFQMGNDEHSTNVIKAAKAQGLATKEYCDQMRAKFEAVWKTLNISYDDFIQTSEPRHIKGVQALFDRIYKNGDITKSHYEGHYCESCEAFLTEKDLINGECPNHKTKPKWIKEENYFFALSKYEQKLLEHIEKHPEFIEPEGRRNEVLGIIKGGLQDISVSRAGFEWGIPVPFDEKHVVYVWFDALLNYATAVGFGTDEKMFKKWWPASCHVIGKDIIRFHCVIWPAMLMSAGIPLPKSVFAHGFVYLRGEKMSKSLGNIVTPLDVAEKFGADSLRYYLMRTSSFGKDADFTWENFIERYNAELANGLGNLVARTFGMINRYFGGDLGKLHRDSKSYQSDSAKALLEIEKKTPSVVEASLNMNSGGDLNFHTALAAIMDMVSAADRYINENPPWELAKMNEIEKVACVLGHVYNALAVIKELIEPFMPETATKMASQLGLVGDGRSLGEQVNLFPRIDTKTTADEQKNKKTEKVVKEKKMENSQVTLGNTPAQLPELIDIGDFAKIDLRVAEIKSAEKVEGADKLLKLQIDIGGEARQIVAGIAKHYEPETLVGRKIVVVANLKPAKLRGIESQGMLLAASSGESVVFLTPEKEIPSGSKVK